MTLAYVLDRDTRAILGRVDEAYSALTFTRRLWDVDTFELAIHREQLYADQLVNGRLVYLPDAGDLLFMAEQIHALREGSRANDLRTVSGPSLEGIATAQRECVPPAGQSHDSVTGVAAETAIKHYVSRNAGPLAAVARQVPGLTIAADQARGLALSASARYQLVLDQLRELGLVAGMGWQITYDSVADNFPFDVIVGVDRSASVFFDFEFETLEATEELDSTLESKTVAIVAGQGEGADREIVTRWLGATEPAGFDRREAFVDARDVELGQTAILQQRGDALLAAAAGQHALEARAHQYGSFRYREHWDLGDIVLVRDQQAGISYSARIIEVEIAITTSGAAPAVKAVLGRPFPTLQERIDGPGARGAVVDRAVSLPPDPHVHDGTANSGGLVSHDVLSGVSAHDHHDHHAARIYRNSNQAVASGVNTIVSFTTERYDHGGLWAATSPTRITLPVAGVWRVGAQMRWTINTAGRRIVRIKVNGSTIIAIGEVNPANSLEIPPPVVTEWEFAAGDYVEVEVLQTSGVSLDIVYATHYTPEIWASLVRAA